MSSAFPLSSILVPWRWLCVLLVSFCICPSELSSTSVSLPCTCVWLPPATSLPTDWSPYVPLGLCHRALWRFSTVGDLFMEWFLKQFTTKKRTSQRGRPPYIFDHEILDFNISKTPGGSGPALSLAIIINRLLLQFRGRKQTKTTQKVIQLLQGTNIYGPSAWAWNHCHRMHFSVPANYEQRLWDARALSCLALRFSRRRSLQINFNSKYVPSVFMEKLIQISNIIVHLFPAVCALVL